jgi:NAD(P)-dependent dehydrogenase (short-subunit alcohol dehydrogenase family)
MTTVTVVTGAASGMGQVAARRLAPTSDVLVLSDLRSADPAGCEGAGRFEVIECDVSDSESVRSLAERVAEHGEVSRLVHAAGVSPTMGDHHRMFDVDLAGSAHIVAAFLPQMAPGGAAVLFASMAAHLIAGADSSELDDILSDPLAPGAAARFAGAVAIGGDSGLAYAWSKQGVIRLVRRAAPAWGARGARINSVSPGTIDTPMGRQEMATHPAMQSMLDVTPMGRMGRSEDLVDAVAFLLSPEASYITGTDLLVDGGAVAAVNIK